MSERPDGSVGGVATGVVGFSRRALMIPTLTIVGRTAGVSNGRPRLDDGRVLEDVRTVVWCTGFRPDFKWIQLPCSDPKAIPITAAASSPPRQALASWD